ncbi:hypothetical protein KR067_011066, partial [Drosophila pandora]
FWSQEVKDIRTYFESQVGADLPTAIYQQLEDLSARVASL